MKNRLLFFACALFPACANLHAQFNAAFLQDKYWNDGKAEFNTYDAKIVRYGQPRECEVIHIIVREPFDPKQLVKPDQWDKPGMIQVLKLNQIFHIPTGIYVYQQMHTNFWRIDDGQLVKFTLTSNDSCGNTFKLWRREDNNYKYTWHTYWDGMASGEENAGIPAGAYFHDELPLRVRTIDFQKSRSGGFDIQLAPTVIKSKKDEIQFAPAKVRYEVADTQISVTVTSPSGADQFILDPKFPHLLRSWKMADGGELKRKSALKIDYWNYHNPGDKERGLGDPKLRNE
jgi:hypothetical protein